MNAISCSAVRRRRGPRPAAERAPGEHQQDQVEADDLAGGEQTRRDQPEHPRIHVRDLPSVRPVGLVSSGCTPNVTVRGVAVVASSGARLPCRPLRGLGDRLAHRPRVLRRRPRRPAGTRRTGCPACPAPTRRCRWAGRSRRSGGWASDASGWCCRCPATSAACPPSPARLRSPWNGAGRRRRAAGAGAGAAGPRGRAVDGVPAGRRPAGRAAGRGLPAGALRVTRPGGRRRRPHPRGPRRRPVEPGGAGAAGRAGEDGAGARAARRPRPARGVRARPRPAAGRRPRPGDGRRPGGRGQPRPGRPARDEALRPLSGAVREAIAAAFNWIPREPSPR